MTKTEQATQELFSILTSITEDGIITKDELSRLINWKIEWKTVSNRGANKFWSKYIEYLTLQSDLSQRDIEILLNIGNSLREKRHPGVPNISDDTLIKLRPITPAQLDLLVANGRSHESASKLNRDQASLAISELFAKQDATPRQIAYLEHLGYDFSDGYNLTKEVASQKITDLVETKGEGELSEEDSDINESDANSQLYERKIQTPSGHQNDKRNGCIGCISFLFIILLVLYFIF